MGLRFCTDTAAASWLLRSDTPPMQLISFGPTGYEAFARLRFISDPTSAGQAEADVDLPDGHPSDMTRARQALHRLASFTATPADCYFGVWDGYSDLELPPGPRFDLPHRTYALLRGPLTAMDTWEQTLGVRSPTPPPALVWPADHAWFFASDVDPHWAGIGATRGVIEALVDDPDLDVVPARPAEPQPTYY
ncbi:MAG: hypothetical protein ACRDSK_02165 [Actinophytocola sp.]|uniref:hypothetical protein n=1 Tax=Actinophytocola sp. TaxID=1872138 RepID=UPI003D6BA57C